MISDVASEPFSPHPARARAFLAQWPSFKPSPLRTIEVDGIGPVLLKDESARLELGSFKALGGTYAVYRLLEDRWSEKYGAPLPVDVRDEKLRDFAQSLTFICASAGNHGMAVAAGARHVGAHARIHLSATVSQRFADRLMGQDAQVIRSGASYEESVAAASRDAEDSSGILLADAAWPGYRRPPALVMEGYTVMAEELRENFAARGAWPSHVFLQAGVGGLAGAITHMIRTTWSVQPRIVIVEPDAAPCLKESARSGKPVTVQGPVSNMGRLDCKEPSLLAFEILRAADVGYQLVSDAQASAACGELAQVHGILTTPSGAAGLAGLRALGVPRDARALVIVTEEGGGG